MAVTKNIADYLAQIETLTNTNLQILQTLNDSFFTKKNHLFAEIDDTKFVIPSFISLENKINMLQENFENLVKSPETGEAYFNFDGNSRAIEVKKYSYTPDSITLPGVANFSIMPNNKFKDFLNPVPYINLELPAELPNDIIDINVKKIIAKSESLKSLFNDQLSYTAVENNTETIKYHTTVSKQYADIYKLLVNFTKDVDYVEYDTIYKLPIRKNIGTGTYIIESIISDEINNDLEELITLKIKNNLNYKLFDEVIEKPLQVGDELINYDGSGKVKIQEIRTNSNTIVVKVVNGEYLNFIGTDSYDTDNEKDIHDLSKLRFYSSIDFDKDKYVKIPLEEDQYVFIAAAPVNNRLNVQSSWGGGILLNTFNLKYDSDQQQNFKEYYNNNVKNIGDILFEISNILNSNSIESLYESEFNALTTYKPILNESALKVMQINSHINNSPTIKNIKNAYNQKKTAETSLEEVQSKINDINEKLTTISFNDTTGIRSTYLAQLSQLNTQKNELLTAINNAINSISLSVNNSEIPIENAKYRIRGFYTPEDITKLKYNAEIIGIQVQYRYKNISSILGNAVSMNGNDGNNTYIFSDWNKLNTTYKSKIVKYVDGKYQYTYEENNEIKNEPSYNQIDIPITQGETVDIRLRVVYSYGQPYITMTSDWSDIINIAFPEEFTKDIAVLTIIEENNNDIETNRFNNILETSGVNSHINDMFMDQNITYFHKPDFIASGFYTEERKVIPLKDKLLTINNDIALLKSNVFGSDINYKITASIGNDITELYSDRNNIIVLESYDNFMNNTSADNSINSFYSYSTDKKVSTMINISIFNSGESVIKLYPIFPGNRDVLINNSKSVYADKNDYCSSEISNVTNKQLDYGVFFTYLNNTDSSDSTAKPKCLQTQNQFITFRINDLWTNIPYYDKNANASPNSNIQEITTLPEIENNSDGLVVYPYLNSKYSLCTDSDSLYSYTIINPGEELIIPLYCEYRLEQTNAEIQKTLSFDIRTSLYKDPVNYTFNVIAKNNISVKDKLLLDNKKLIVDNISLIPNKYKYSTTIK